MTAIAAKIKDTAAGSTHDLGKEMYIHSCVRIYSNTVDIQTTLKRHAHTREIMAEVMERPMPLSVPLAIYMIPQRKYGMISTMYL